MTNTANSLRFWPKLVSSSASKVTKIRSLTGDVLSEDIEVHLFTDGGCSGNPGPGGWGFILRHLASGKEIERSGGMPMTTNNQMELEAVIQGLTTLKRPCNVEVFTDSVYVGKASPSGWSNGNVTAGNEKKAASSKKSKTSISGNGSTNKCNATK